MIQGVLLGVLLAGGPGSRISTTHETRIGEDGRLVCTRVEETSDPAALHRDPSSRVSVLTGWEEEPSDVTIQEGNFTVIYKNFPSDEFREAFQHGVGIWDSILDVRVPVKIMTRYLPLPDERSAAGSVHVESTCDNRRCRPAALQNQVHGRDLNGRALEARVTIYDLEGSTYYPEGWHLEKEWSPPQGGLDLITVVMHELGHAFGIVSNFYLSECCAAMDPWQPGCCAAVNHWHNNPFQLYDTFIWTQEDGRLIDLPSPSEKLLEALKKEVFWGRTGWKNVRGEPMLTPEVAMGPVVVNGLTVFGGRLDSSHMSSEAYPYGTVNSLMATANPGVSLRHPGPIVMAMLYDMGWDLKTDIPADLPPPPPRRDDLPPPVPTEPPPMPDVQLTATQRGGWYQLLLRWEVAPSAYAVYRYNVSLYSPNRKHRHNRLWTYPSQPHARYLVRKSWGPFTIRVRAVNELGGSPNAIVIWPEE